MISTILAILRDDPPRSIDLTGATDGYFEAWDGTQQVTPDFTGMKLQGRD